MEKIKLRAGIPPSASDETVCRVPRKAGIKWIHAQRKGILTKNDLKLRLKFASTVQQKLPNNFWTEEIGLYLDKANFKHTTDPFDQARALEAMV